MFQREANQVAYDQWKSKKRRESPSSRSFNENILSPDFTERSHTQLAPPRNVRVAHTERKIKKENKLNERQDVQYGWATPINVTSQKKSPYLSFVSQSWDSVRL